MREQIKNRLLLFLYIVTTLFGLFLILKWDRSLVFVRYGLLLIITIISLIHIILRLIIQRQWTIQACLQLLSYLLLLYIVQLYFTPQTATLLISIGGGLWLVLDGVIKCFYAIQQFQKQRRQSILSMLFGISTLCFALVLFQHEVYAVHFMQFFLGSYFIIFGLFHFLDMIIHKPYFIRYLNRIKLFEMTPRTIFSIYSPRTFRLYYDELSQSEKKQFKKSYSINKDVKEEVQLHVYVHMKYPLAHMFGHVDFALEGTNYTYGNYDDATLKWKNNKSDGVLIVSPNHKYLSLNVRHYRKIIAAFTLNITVEQKDRLLQAIDKLIIEEAYPWNPETLTKKLSYSKTINKQLNALFYKFEKKSINHTYITATSNCVHFFDTIAQSGGVKIFPNQTITTPGDIFNILNTYAEDQNDTLVTRRKLLTKEDFEIK